MNLASKGRCVTITPSGIDEGEHSSTRPKAFQPSVLDRLLMALGFGVAQVKSGGDHHDASR